MRYLIFLLFLVFSCSSTEPEFPKNILVKEFNEKLSDYKNNPDFDRNRDALISIKWALENTYKQFFSDKELLRFRYVHVDYPNDSFFQIIGTEYFSNFSKVIFIKEPMARHQFDHGDEINALTKDTNEFYLLTTFRMDHKVNFVDVYYQDFISNRDRVCEITIKVEGQVDHPVTNLGWDLEKRLINRVNRTIFKGTLKNKAWNLVCFQDEPIGQLIFELR